MKFKVYNVDYAFDHRKIIAYDINEPNNIHEILKNGGITEIPLPNLVDQPAGVYANWVVKMPRIIEGDINEDGKCDFNDLEVMSSEWLVSSNPNGIPAGSGNYLASDLNSDGETNFLDFAIFAKDYGKSE